MDIIEVVYILEVGILFSTLVFWPKDTPLLRLPNIKRPVKRTRTQRTRTRKSNSK